MDIAKVRLVNQHISGNKCKTAEEVVRSLGAVQAQDYNQSLWAIGLRMERATLGDIEKALAERKIIRSWGMRGTLHFILAEDAHWMRDIFGPLILSKYTPKVWEYHATTPKMVELAAKVFTKALSGGKTLKRPEMLELLKSAGIREDKQQSYFLFAYLCQTGLLCLGESQDGKQTFALLDEWVPKPRKLSREESLATLAGRFFTSHGPATLADFANWTGLKMPDAKYGLELVKSQFSSETIDGKEYYFRTPAKEGSGTFLLPGYDELVIGYKDRSPNFKHGEVKIATYNGMFYATTVIDGQVVGTWKRVLSKTRMNIQLGPTTIPVNEAAVQAEVTRLGAFYGSPAFLKN